jgi:hypothetical protein
MSIEFPCSQCGKLLRVGDDAAGKQARCPSCGSVQPIPFTSPSAEPTPEAGQAPSPFGGYTAQPAADQLNPYASPTSIPEMPSPAPFGEYWGPRTGPPWERDGASFASFMATLKQAYSSPQLLFREMRREGGLMAPLGFSFAGGMVGGLATFCYQIGLQVFMLQVANPPNMGGQAAAPLAVTAVMFAVMIPVGIVLQAFLGSAIFHLCLMVVGGANQSFETTFRVVTYSSGCAAPLGLIPICGPYIQSIFALVLNGMGFAYAHETSGTRATFAVLLPVIVCCGFGIVMYAVIIGLVIANAQ